MMDIDFEITHRCNKFCPTCSHRIKTSNFDSITLDQLQYVLSCFKNPRKITGIVLIIGGEPLCHPQYIEVLDMIDKKFKWKKALVISTNGKDMDKVPKDVLKKYNWRISHYPGWNDEIVSKYRKLPNVKILGFGGWWNPDQDPNLTIEQAKKVEKRCFHQFRIIGTKIYRCCLSEGVERHFKTNPVHIEMSESWLEDWKKIPIWYACQHCFKANEVYLKSKTDAEKQGRCMSHNGNEVDNYNYKKWKDNFKQRGRFQYVD